MSLVTAWLLAATLTTLPPQAEETPPVGAIDGRVVVTLGGEELTVRQLGAMVVYLEGIDEPIAFDAPKAPAVIRQKDAKFLPNFLVVPVGQKVEIPNEDKIFHNVFSYSKPNQFDLGLYEEGAVRSITFDHPGVVKIYCSIHESMNGMIIVTPSPFFDRVHPDGSFRLDAIPPGKYRLVAWSERAPELKSEVEVVAGDRTQITVNLRLDPPKNGAVRPSSADGSGAPAPATTPGSADRSPGSNSHELDCCEEDVP